MRLNKIDDPRDRLGKARLWELQAFARKHNVEEVEEDMPATLVRKILRAKGLHDIAIPHRPLGMPERPGATSGPVQDTATAANDSAEIDADEDLMRQWKASKAAPAPAPKAFADMNIQELRSTAKKAGIKSANTWKRPDFIRILEARDEPHTA